MAHDQKLDFPGYKPSTDPNFKPDRDRSRSPKRQRGDSWRPTNTVEDESIQHTGRRWRGKARVPTKNEYRERSPHHSRDAARTGPPKKSRNKGKSQNDGEETKGLSDKIHSLRRLLDKATDMPADIRQDKERELQGYVADQQRHLARREKNAVTSRYHFVRFMERKKADRQVKRLEKNADSVIMERDSATISENSTVAQVGKVDGDAEGTTAESHSTRVLSSAERLALQQEDYKRRLHEAKVDLNYTLYAPLDQKYISLYPPTKDAEFQRNNRRARSKRNIPASVNVNNDDDAGIFRNDSGQKPPLWYEVEKAMQNDTLEALRDGKVLKADIAGAQFLTFRSMAEPANGKRVPGIESGSDGEDKDDDSEDDFFEGGARL